MECFSLWKEEDGALSEERVCERMCANNCFFNFFVSRFYDSISSFSCGLFARGDVSGRNK